MSYLPLVVHELDERRIRAPGRDRLPGRGRRRASVGLPAALPIVGLRVLGWPLTGLITAAPVATIAGGGPRRRADDLARLVRRSGWPRAPARRRTAERTGVRWLGLGLLWTVLALAVGAPSLATVVLGLPNDHYHAFADPMVFVLVGVGVAALVRVATKAHGRWDGRSGSRRRARRRDRGRASSAGTLATQPPAVAADGGWPAAEAAAARILVATGGGPVALESLPAVKSADAVRFPLERLVPGHRRRRARLSAAPQAPARVVLCDQLFHETIGADCGGPAEDALVATGAAGAAPATVIDRFEAAPGRWISVYRAATP